MRPVDDHPPTIATEIERYLRTGRTDPHCAAWSGTFSQRMLRARDDLRGALVGEVRRLANGREHAPLPLMDPVAYTRKKVEPMVRGLFPRAEQEAVLAVLEESVVFVTSENIEQLLLDESFDHDAWDLANLYLGSLDAELLGEDALRIVGMSEHMTCFVSPAYFEEDDPFADFIVHEAAHIFHNCKRETVGLRPTRTKQWLLDIEFRKRETFAYSCEAYARVLERGRTPAERRARANEYAGGATNISDERVDRAEVADIVVERLEGYPRALRPGGVGAGENARCRTTGCELSDGVRVAAATFSRAPVYSRLRAPPLGPRPSAGSRRASPAASPSGGTPTRRWALKCHAARTRR